MRLLRQMSFEEWTTLEKIKRDLQKVVAKSLSDKGKPVNPIYSIGVPAVNTIEETIFKTKTKL